MLDTRKFEHLGLCLRILLWKLYEGCALVYLLLGKLVMFLEWPSDLLAL